MSVVGWDGRATVVWCRLLELRQGEKGDIQEVGSGVVLESKRVRRTSLQAWESISGMGSQTVHTGERVPTWQ